MYSTTNGSMPSPYSGVRPLSTPYKGMVALGKAGGVEQCPSRINLLGHCVILNRQRISQVEASEAHYGAVSSRLRGSRTSPTSHVSFTANRRTRISNVLQLIEQLYLRISPPKISEVVKSLSTIERYRYYIHPNTLSSDIHPKDTEQEGSEWLQKTG